MCDCHCTTNKGTNTPSYKLQVDNARICYIYIVILFILYCLYISCNPTRFDVPNAWILPLNCVGTSFDIDIDPISHENFTYIVYIVCYNNLINIITKI